MTLGAFVAKRTALPCAFGLNLAVVLTALAIVLAGCADLNSIYRSRDFSNTSQTVLLVDAKQRAIFSSPRPISASQVDAKGTVTNTFVTKYRAFCSEPSPDVFSVLSQAASASGDFTQDAETIRASLQAAFSNSETGSTISRTQTVNMLREMMFRTCERYLSGALGPLEFSTQAVRDQRIMVSILAIEQLTGVATPRATVLSATSNANAGQNTSEAIVRVDDAWNNLQTADAKQKDAQSKFDQLEGAAPKCSEIKDKVDKSQTLTAAETAKRDQCSTAQSILAQAQADRKAASDRYETLKALADGTGPVSTTSTGQLLSDADSGKTDQNTDNVGAVAGAVERIVASTFEQDEYELFCLRVMDPTLNTNSTIMKSCLEYLNARLNRLKEEENLRAQQAAKTAQELGTATLANFDAFWRKVETAPNAVIADAQKLRSTVDAYLVGAGATLAPPTKGRIEALKAKTARADILELFRLVPLPQQAELAK